MSTGRNLLDRVVMIRRQIATQELGMVVPIIRLRDNLQLGQTIQDKNKGIEVAEGELVMDGFTAGPGDRGREIEGTDTLEPAFGLPAKWLRRKRIGRKCWVYRCGPAHSDFHPPTGAIKAHIHELLGRQVKLVDNLKENHPPLWMNWFPSK